jgi:putative ABC transport system permease protein
MLLSHFKIAWRTILKNRIYSIVNLLGLTIGIAAALLIYRIVRYEWSFNKDLTNYERIVRVVSKELSADMVVNYNPGTPVPALKLMQQQISEFEAYSPIRECWVNLTVPNPAGGPPLKKFGVKSPEIGFMVEPAFFKIIQVEWLAGDPATALTDPQTIVLNQTWAEKCFDGWENAVGKTILIDNNIPVTVKGVFKDLPVNCDFPLAYLISYATLTSHKDYFNFFNEDSWGACSSNDQAYALVKKGTSLESLDKSLSLIGREQYKDGANIVHRVHFAQPLSDLHYNEEIYNSGQHVISKSRLNILSSIGILILIMACFNFINLSTAQASLRAKEVGIRKTLGSKKHQLFSQFMTETFIIVLVSVTAGTILAFLASPLLKHVSDVPDALPFFDHLQIWFFLAAVTIFVTFLSGFYPSLMLSAFQPVKVMKNSHRQGLTGGTALRKILVVLQFVIAQALVAGAIITLMQLNYIRSKELGFTKELIYNFGINSDSMTVIRQEALRQKLLQLPTVESVTLSSDDPMSGNTWATNFRFGTRTQDEKYPVTIKMCDAEYQKNYDIRLLAGNWYMPSDTMREVVINQTLLHKLGIKDPGSAINESIFLGSGGPLRIVGVAADFHAHSLRQEFQPMLLGPTKKFYSRVAVRIRPDDIKGSVASIQRTFDEILPEQVFEGDFFDTSITRFYEDDNRLSATCKGFGFLAIVISCLGLFGLATHAAAQRVKEIGIRKVLGASVSGIVALLSKDFLKLVLLSLFIATPIAWYFMQQWLQNFVYRIDIQWWVFALSGLLGIVVALLTISIQSIRAAMANPVKSLRSE